MDLFLDTARLTRTTAGDPALDGSLISRCKNRDAEAFSLIVDRYQSRVFGFARRMLRSNEDAEDVTQEVFVRAFENMHRFDGRASLSTWLFKIASNLCIDRARRKGRRPEEVPLFFGSPEVSSPGHFIDFRSDPEGSVVAGEMAETIEIAIGKLSPKLRGVLLLHDVEELSYDEISQIVGIPVGTVKSRLFLARGHLQSALKGYIDGESWL